MVSSLLTVLLTYFVFCPVMQLQAGVIVKTDITCDVCVAGGGSSGFGAALAAARSGASVLKNSSPRRPALHALRFPVRI
jgi:NADPH-dependent 2,4-dienoyl-CoA reductase/sulfur reductase-like enzyme